MLDVRLQTLHLIEPFRIAHGASSTRQVARLWANGAVGEAPFVPYYGDDPEQTVAWLREVEEPFSRLPAEGPRAGLLALDLLQRDRAGTRAGQPLAAQVPLASARAGAIPACRSFSIPTDLPAFADRVRDTARQFQVLKLKLGSGNADFDEAIVAMAREAAPQVELIADVNGGWSVAETLKMMRALRRWRPALIEQPVHHRDGLEPWRELKAKLPSDVPPLFADETAQPAADVPALAELVAGVNVKLLKCGSFAGAVSMIEVARRHRLGLILGCMIESSIGVTAAAHLAPWADWVDLDGHLYVADDDHVGLAFDAQGCLVMPQT
ncbi:MAG TPA: enolase C-terminal domain-like protein, partial [Prosthecobacter sp.]|nr:enolase C-terminal domain-like protein [Prosthecobacter sp.]